MTSGSQSLKQGLSDVVNLIYNDAKEVARARTEAAVLKAQGEIGVMNQKFLAWVGSAEFKPEDFDGRFQELQDQQEAYADSIDVVRARPLVKGAAQSAIPEIYARGAAAMNRQQLGLATADFNSAIENAWSDKTLTTDERWSKVSALYDQGRTMGFMDQVKLGQSKSALYRVYKMDKTEEVARSTGILQDGIELLYSDDAMMAAGLGDLTYEERDAVAMKLVKEQTVKSKKALEETEKELLEAVDTFIDIPTAFLDIDTMDISPDAKNKMKIAMTNHNNDTKYSSYQQRINNTDSAVDLQKIMDDLEVEGSGYLGERDVWVGKEEEKKRADLRMYAESKMAKILSLEGGGASSDDETVRFSRLYEKFKAGQVTYGQAYSAGLMMNSTNKSNPAFKTMIKDLESWMPPNGQFSFDGLKKTVTTGSKGFWKDNPEAASWALDAYSDFAKKNPAASSDTFRDEAARIQAVYIGREMEYIRGEKIKEGVFGYEKKLIDIGGKIQDGELSSAVNIDPMTGVNEIAPNVKERYGQWSSWEVTQAKNKYGIDAVARTNEDGTQVLVAQGKEYTFVYKDKKAFLVDSNGRVVEELAVDSSPADVPEISVKDAAMYPAIRGSSRSEGTPANWDKMGVQQRAIWYSDRGLKPVKAPKPTIQDQIREMDARP